MQFDFYACGPEEVPTLGSVILPHINSIGKEMLKVNPFYSNAFRQIPSGPEMDIFPWNQVILDITSNSY